MDFVITGPAVWTRAPGCPEVPTRIGGPIKTSVAPGNRPQSRYSGGSGGAPPGKSAPRPSPLQAAAETSASPPSVGSWGVEAPGVLDGAEPLKLLAWTGRR